MSFIRKYRIGGKIYLAEVESRRVKGKVVQRFIRYVGKQADGKTILSTSISDVSVSEVRLYGPLLVLHHLAQEIGLPEHLGPYATRSAPSRLARPCKNSAGHSWPRLRICTMPTG